LDCQPRWKCCPTAMAAMTRELHHD
jgi:hypothetical protein